MATVAEPHAAGAEAPPVHAPRQMLDAMVLRLRSPMGRRAARDVARILSVALVPLLAQADEVVSLPVYGFLGLFVLATALVPRNRVIDVAEISAATIIAVVTGGLTSPFLPYLMVAVLVVGVRSTMVVGAAAGTAVAAGLTWPLATNGLLSLTDIVYLVPLIVFLPLVGFTAAMTRRVVAGIATPGHAALEEANKLLQASTSSRARSPAASSPP
jgi:hypothetical protein